jgi:predicted nucleotidyltransferase
MDESMPVLHKSPAVDLKAADAWLRVLRQWDPEIRVTLFGSRARRTHSFYSDYDLLILSERFSGMTPNIRYKTITSMLPSPDLEIEIQPVCYTSKEWSDRHDSLMAAEIARDGVELEAML